MLLTGGSNNLWIYLVKNDHQLALGQPYAESQGSFVTFNYSKPLTSKIDIFPAKN